MSGRRRRLQGLLGSVVLLLSVGFVVAALLDRGNADGAISVSTSSAMEDFGHLEFDGRGRSMARRELDLLYVIKRRVPNGADPIHNRGEGQSARPPGRV